MIRLLILCLVIAAFAAGCGSSDLPPGDMAPEAASVIDGSLTGSGGLDKTARTRAAAAVEDSHEYDVDIIVIDDPANGEDIAARKKLVDKLCSKNPDKQYLQVLAFTTEYLPTGRLDSALAKSEHPALVMAIAGDGKNLYQAYAEEVVKNYNASEQESLSPRVKLSCSQARDQIKQLKAARDAAAADPDAKAQS